MERLSRLGKKVLLIACWAMVGPWICRAAASDSVLEKLRALPPLEMDEVVWLARCMLSESDRGDEQELVAWVVRNRVETAYRGETYREVVLETLQFSAFNTPSPRRTYLLSLNQHTNVESWVKAVEVAMKVYAAPATDRPFSRETRHFYSPISMKNGATPPWAVNATPLDLSRRQIDPKRFLFFEAIDEALDPFIAGQAPAERIRTFQEGAREALEEARPRTSSRVSRLQPSGRVLRPARPGVSGTRKAGLR